MSANNPKLSPPNRRAALQVGGLSLLGLNALQLDRLRANSTTSQPRANSCVFIFLFGGPSHIDLWDMKPDAPVENRGDFNPVPTKVPGIDLCEHLPLLAQQTDKLCLLRSMTHGMNVHGPACSEILTGREYPFPPTTDMERPEDWPSISALTMQYGRQQPGLPNSIVLPWYLQFPGQERLIAGQRAGRMGRGRDAMLVEGDPSQPDFAMQGFLLPEDVSHARLVERRRVLSKLAEQADQRVEEISDVRDFEQNHLQAYEMLNRKAGQAFDLSGESPKLRERYGESKIAQSFLLARRLVEAGVSLVTVNWEDETKISGTDTCWDTHKDNFDKLKTLLCPMFDRCFSAFLQDLDDRGLLETTLVVAVGEFGRTPKLGQFTQSSNTKPTGRDHWPHAFTALVAGGGVRGGQVYGRTTYNAGYVEEKPVSPADLAATIFHHLGIDHTQTYHDHFQNIPRHLSEGEPVTDLG
ncbi:MAG: DUF1501 domain-containing protein [Planctomycetota bacterium]|nr:MAG: DUF1501 domain-containing protein [Planctomycetota bacterium]REK31701.1 MAG: DUF1501 domain-containing protein [Planctomycetota bacterium]